MRVQVNVIWLILIKYCIACSLTFFSSENFTNIAWDSAGVTTGPVTVPFVLSLGIGCVWGFPCALGFRASGLGVEDLELRV